MMLCKDAALATLRAMQESMKGLTVAAGVLGFLGVALGAFGAHGLKDVLTERGSAGTWQTAVLYHLVHSVALLALTAYWRGAAGIPSPALWAGWSWTIGVVLFSGSLYWLALGGPKLLGPITPLGGLAFLAGWALVAWSALSAK
jgi:uncharacterized membrane protein YgdD (TMEM256/DUF423 family)